MRLAHYFVGEHNALGALLYSDDGKLTGRMDYPGRGLLLSLLALIVIDLPLAWKKHRAGLEAEWIGYFLDLGKFELGVTFSRMVWAANRFSEKVAEG